jgi:hypothetical protein
MRASTGIVCIDEADKIARRNGGGSGTGGRDVGGEGVQQVRMSSHLLASRLSAFMIAYTRTQIRSRHCYE